MPQKTLHITIPTGDRIERDLSIRYTVVDTIEHRKIGEVLEEGTEAEAVHIWVQLKSTFRLKKREAELYSLLKSLGLGDAIIEEVENE